MIANNNETPFVSIIVRSKNDREFIEETLMQIYGQDFDHFELVCVDSGSNDGTYEVMQRFEPQVIYQIRPEEYVPGKVLNEAILKCSGEIIVFNNSDCIPQNSSWLKELITPLVENRNVVATYGRQIPRPDAELLVRKDMERAYGDGSIAAKWFHFFSLATSAIRKDDLFEYPFDPTFQYSEDIEWSFRMKKLGRTIHYSKDAIVEHSHNYTLSEVKKRFYEEGKAEAGIYKTKNNVLTGFAIPLVMEVLRDIRYLAAKRQFMSIPQGLVYRCVQKYSAYKGRKEHFVDEV